MSRNLKIHSDIEENICKLFDACTYNDWLILYRCYMEITLLRIVYSYRA